MDQGLKYTPNEEDRLAVMLFAARCIPNQGICKMLQINTDTLNKYYQRELDCGKLIHEVELHKILWRHAHGKNQMASIKAATYLLDTIHKWSSMPMEELIDKVKEKMRTDAEATMLKEKEAKYEC